MSPTSKDGILALCGSLTGLSVCTVGLHFYGGKQQKRSFHVDDWLALASVITYFGTCIIIFILVHGKGIGHSSTDFTAEELQSKAALRGHYAYASDFIKNTPLALVKLSVLFFYRRLLHTGAGTKELFVRVVMALVAIVLAWYITVQFLVGFQCPGHFSAAWETTAAKYCTLNFVWSMGMAVSDFLLDLIVLLLPIPRIWRIQTSTKKKLSIIGVFCLAFVGLGASIARIVVYDQTQVGGSVKYFCTHDPELANTEVAYIQMPEAGITVTAVNLPSLWIVCTSIIPAKIHNGMHSVRTLLSSSSPRSLQSSAAERVGSTDNYFTEADSTGDVGVLGERSRQLQYPLPLHSKYGGGREDRSFVAYEAYELQPRIDNETREV